MQGIFENRVVILDTEGNIVKYSYDFAQHQSCCFDFAEKNGYEYSGVCYLAKRGNGVFQMMGNDNLVAFLPDKLNDMQLYGLEYMGNFLDNIEYLRVGKVNDKEQIIEEYMGVGDEVIKTFNDIIMSYYNNSKSR